MTEQTMKFGEEIIPNIKDGWLVDVDNSTISLILTSGLLRAVSMAKPGPKPVKVFTLVEVGRGLRH